MSNTIKTAIDYPPKLALGQFSYVNCFKLAQITKKIDNFGLRVERSKIIENEHICKKTGVLKNFANFTVKHLCWSLVLLKRDCNKGDFL